MATALIGALAGLAGQGLDLYGGLHAIHEDTWNQNAKVGVLNALNELLKNSVGNIDAYGNAIMPNLTGFSMDNLQKGNAQQDNALSFLGGLMNKINNGALTNPTDLGRVPYLDDVLNTLTKQYGSTSSLSDFLSNQVTGGIANNPQLAQVFKQAGNLAGGGGGQQTLADIANEIFSNRGQDAFGGALRQSASALLPNQGYNPQLNYATTYGEQLTQPNPTVQQAQARAGQLLAQNPLLPMDQAVSIARNQSATDSFNQFQALKRQLANQTGMTGPAIAGGGINEFLNEAGDQAMQAQAQANANALLNQQNLQSQLFGQGVNLFGQGQQAALGNSGQGLNAILQAANQATSNLGTAGNLGLASTAQDLQRLLSGGQLQGQANNTTLQALNSILSGLGTQNQMTGTSLSGIGNLLNSQNQDLSQWANNLFGVQNLGQTAGQNSISDLLQAINSTGNMGGQQVGQGLTAAQFPAQQLNNWMSMLGNVYQNMTGLFGNPSNPVNYMSSVGNLLSKGNPLGGVIDAASKIGKNDSGTLDGGIP